MKENIRIIDGAGCWMESRAVEQLEKTAELPGVVRAVGLPDLHPGRTPVGAVFETEGRIYPHLLGNDLGCGMTLFRTGISPGQYRAEQWIRRLRRIENAGRSNHLRTGDDDDVREPAGGPDARQTTFRPGTLGGGNHFAEFQVCETFGGREILLLIHSGSRGLGQEIYERFGSPQGLTPDTDDWARYLQEHRRAVEFARENRRATAERLLERLGYHRELVEVIDCCHNLLEERDGRFLHRKGAAAAEPGRPVVIPGSRGSLTYVAMPTERVSETLWSLAHGAGRKYQRSACRDRFREKYRAEELTRTKLKSAVVCSDKNLLYEEAPEAYKDIESVIDCMRERGLIEIKAVLRPLLTYKG